MLTPDNDHPEGKLGAIVGRYATEGQFSGAVLVTQGDRELLARASGFAHRGFSVPNAVGTRFDTASLGKLFTAAATFRLVDRGLLGLDEPVRDLAGLRDTAIPADVTIRHCLTHSSGIADDADEEAGEDYEELWKAKPCYMVREARDFVPQFAYKAPLFKAGTKSRYNNCAYVLVGLVLEAKTGLPFPEIVEREVLEPAGLGDTGYFAKDSIASNVAEGYATVGDSDGGTASGDAAPGGPAGFRKNIYAFPPIGSPDSGIITTVRDLRKLFLAIEGDTFLSPGLRAEFLSPQIDAFTLKSGELRRYGYCLEHDIAPSGRRIRYGKDGINPGVAAIAMRYPDSDGFIAILANQDANVWMMYRELAKAAGFAD